MNSFVPASKMAIRVFRRAKEFLRSFVLREAFLGEFWRTASLPPLHPDSTTFERSPVAGPPWSRWYASHAGLRAQSVNSERKSAFVRIQFYPAVRSQRSRAAFRPGVLCARNFGTRRNRPVVADASARRRCGSAQATRRQNRSQSRFVRRILLGK